MSTRKYNPHINCEIVGNTSRRATDALKSLEEISGGLRTVEGMAFNNKLRPVAHGLAVAHPAVVASYQHPQPTRAPAPLHGDKGVQQLSKVGLLELLSLKKEEEEVLENVKAMFTGEEYQNTLTQETILSVLTTSNWDANTAIDILLSNDKDLIADYLSQHKTSKEASHEETPEVWPELPSKPAVVSEVQVVAAEGVVGERGDSTAVDANASTFPASSEDCDDVDDDVSSEGSWEVMDDIDADADVQDKYAPPSPKAEHWVEVTTATDATTQNQSAGAVSYKDALRKTPESSPVTESRAPATTSEGEESATETTAAPVVLHGRDCACKPCVNIQDIPAPSVADYDAEDQDPMYTYDKAHGTGFRGSHKFRQKSHGKSIPKAARGRPNGR
eukprot:GFYU01000724.1.p1 GENE.GFYU01000724.1~~GFYU01000724.1.p1  ORF type:complete len:389 (-),score=124.45 GFYU01000724.1:130-1296(-)